MVLFLVDFIVTMLDLSGSVNVSLQALHGFRAVEQPDTDIFTLNLCCRQDGNTETPIQMGITMPFLLVKVNNTNKLHNIIYYNFYCL